MIVAAAYFAASTLWFAVRGYAITTEFILGGLVQSAVLGAIAVVVKVVFFRKKAG